VRARSPITRVDGPTLVVRTELVAADGTELPPLEVSLPRAHADLLDPTASPALPTLATVAAARGEDLEVEGPVDPAARDAAMAVADLLARRWGTDPIAVRAAEEAPAARTGTGVGLFFTRGADSWSTLLDLLDAPPPARVTHLVSVFHGPRPTDAPLHAELEAGHRAVAAELGLTLVSLGTTARDLLDPLQPWGAVVGPVLVSTGLVAAAGMARLVLSGVNRAAVPMGNGSDPALLALLSTPATEVVLGNPDRDRLQRLAHILGHRRARATLQVCWEGGTAGNCGRCSKCLSTSSGLLLAGDPDHGGGFDVAPTPEAVRTVRLGPADTSGLAARLADELPPEHEDLRRAWADVRDLSAGAPPRARWGDWSPPGLAGPGVPTRVARALRATTGTADGPTPAPLGWRPGTVPLRPALADHDRVRARARRDLGGTRAWAVVEHHIRDDDRDVHQAVLAARLQAHHGPGTCYLPGILWAPRAAPGLDPDAVARLLATARARLWWRAEGDLEPLRVVEAVEHGLLPLQVMPDAAAHHLAAALDPPLAGLVVAESDVPGLDLSPAAVAARRGPVVEHLLRGSAERDLMAGAYRA